MDCMTAQGLISDAVDREPVDPQQLTEAKEHCAGCEACSLFVRTLLIAKNSPTPAPPADLVDRVMLAVRAEHARAQEIAVAAELAAAARAAAVLPAESTPAGALPAPDGAPSPETRSARAASPRPTSRVAAVQQWVHDLSPREFLTWASAAVIFVAAVGIGTVAGVRVLAPQSAPTDTASTSGAVEFGSADGLATTAPEASGSAASKQYTPATSTAGSYVTIGGVVFVLSGPSTSATEGLKPAGTVVTSLGTDSPPSSHDVFSASDPDRVYVVDGSQLLAFDRVVRTYSGRTYQLTSADVPAYGQWPTLPSSIAQPTSEDGSPTFLLLSDDPSGAGVYRLTSTGPETGIGVAPGTPAGDPAAGNPNWTWWVRVP